MGHVLEVVDGKVGWQRMVSRYLMEGGFSDLVEQIDHRIGTPPGREIGQKKKLVWSETSCGLWSPRGEGVARYGRTKYFTGEK